MNKWDNKIRLNSNIVTKAGEDETVILDLEGEVYHGLNPTGAKMLATLVAEESVDDALVKLVEVYQVDESLLRTDLSALIDTLTEKNIIEWIEK